MKPLILLFFLAMFFFADAQENKEQLIGLWTFHKSHISNSNITVSYKKANAFAKGGGFEFKANNALIVRETLGWCATPPITYTNYKGIWELKNPSTLILEYDDWEGKKQRKLTLVSVSDSIVQLKWSLREKW